MPTALGCHIYAGGFTLGVSRHFDVRAVLEDSGYGSETHRANFPDIPVIVGKNNWPPTLDEVGSVDWIFVNPPCAIFSPVGIAVTRGPEAWRSDPRLRCWYDCFELVEKLRPRAFALESVPQAYTRGREVVDELTRRGLLMGYSVTHLLENAMWLGAPQSRNRFFFILHRPSNLRYALARARPNWAPPPPVGDVLAEVSDPGPWDNDLSRVGETLLHTKPGEGLREVWERMHPDFETRRVNGRVVGRPQFMSYRLDPTEPLGAWVQDTVYHPTENRKLGENEMRAICGFPADFILTGRNPGENGSLLARGVLPAVAEWLARVIAAALEEPDGPWEARTVTRVDLRKPDRDPVDLTSAYLTEAGKLRLRLQKDGTFAPADDKRVPKLADVTLTDELAGLDIEELKGNATADIERPALVVLLEEDPVAQAQPVVGPSHGLVAAADLKLEGETSGRYIKRMWLTGRFAVAGGPDELAELVRAQWPGRKTTAGDVRFNYYELLRETEGVPPWPARLKTPRAVSVHRPVSRDQSRSRASRELLAPAAPDYGREGAML